MSNKIIGNPTTTPIRVDQTYNGESKNPQSGKAVAEAIKEVEDMVDGMVEEIGKILDEI